MFAWALVGLLVLIAWGVWYTGTSVVAAHRQMLEIVRVADARVREFSEGEALSNFRYDAQRSRVALEYLRSYVWETLDRRYIGDLRAGGEFSTHWKRRFGDPHGGDYGLWTRESDIQEGWTRDVVEPALARDREKRAAAEPPDQENSETNSPDDVS